MIGTTDGYVRVWKDNLQVVLRLARQANKKPTSLDVAYEADLSWAIPAWQKRQDAIDNIYLSPAEVEEKGNAKERAREDRDRATYERLRARFESTED